MSRGDVELSIVSKNFFFTFFNFFIVFTALGTAALSFENFGDESLRETANKLAQNISTLRQFYVNYIILQAFGLFPLRLLEFGNVTTYPFGVMTSKTPRGLIFLSSRLC
jgi:calcium permeable stress-gated cation channel